MQRLNLIVIIVLAVACLGYAQTSGSTPMAAPAGAGVSGTAAETPLAPPPGSGVTPAAGTASVTTNTTTPGVMMGTSTAAPAGAVSPEIHLETVMPAPGATSNMAGAPAGVTNSSNNAGTISSPTTYTVPVQENAPQPQPDVNATAGQSVVIDMNGMVFAGGGAAGAGSDDRSLAEVAAQYKRGRATQNGRTFTNEDIARLNARNDANVMGAEQNAALPQSEGVDPAQPAAKKGQRRSPFAPKTNEPSSSEPPQQ